MSKLLPTLGLALINTIMFGQTVSLPYKTGFDTPTQKAGWAEYKKGGTATGGWLFSTVSTVVYSAPETLWQIYSTSENVDNWFVSPGFSIPAGGKLDSIRYMFNGFSVPAVADTVALYLLKGSANPSSATKTLLFDIRGTDYVNDGVYRKKTGIVLPAAAGNSYLAIRFKCTQGTWLQTYFDNLSLSANPTTGITEAAENRVNWSLAPNPSSGYITVYSQGNKPHSIRILNALGVFICEKELDESGQASIVDLPGGIYFIQSATQPGFITKLIKH